MKRLIYLSIFLLLGFSAFFAVRAGINTATPGQTGLIAYWSFDEGSGSIAGDFSGNGNDGTLQNGPTWVDGKQGQALDFDGSDDQISIPQNVSFQPQNVSYGGWIKSKGEQDKCFILSQYLSWMLQFSGDDLKPRAWYDNNGTREHVSNDSVSLEKNKWYHVFVTIEGNNKMNFYLNGSLKDSVNFPGSIWYENVGSNLIISRSGWWADESTRFTGQLDEVRIYDRALSQSEIQDLYEKGLARIEPPDRTGMVGYWSLDDGSGSVAGDFSENNNDGTINGATWTDGKIGDALEFDGSDDYVDLPDNLGYSNQVSAFAWFKHKAPPPGNYHIIMGGSQLEISINSNGYLRTGVYTDSRHVSDHGSGLNDGQWHYVGFTFDGNTKKSYIDGNFAGELSGITGTLTSSFSNRRIGRYGSSGTYYLNGIVDDIHIYDRALSESEIQDLYNDTNHTVINASQNDRVTDGLVGMWSFNGPDLSGTTATDVSGNGNDGTLTNGPQPTIGQVGQALDFDGSNDYILAHYNTSEIINSDHTILLWTKSDEILGTSNSDRVTPYVDKESWAIGLWYHGGNIRVHTDGVYVDYSWQQDTDWHLMGQIYDASKNELKVILDGQTYVGTESSYSATPSGDFSIGDVLHTDATVPFNGTLDEVRIYNRVLSESEVKRLYKMGK
jgi:hypothetical protein